MEGGQQLKFGKIKCYYCIKPSTHRSGRYKYCIDLKVEKFIDGGLSAMAQHTNNIDKTLKKMKEEVKNSLGFQEVELIKLPAEEFKW